MATVILTLTDGVGSDEVGVQVAFDTPYNEASPAHVLAAQLMTDLSQQETRND